MKPEELINELKKLNCEDYKRLRADLNRVFRWIICLSLTITILALVALSILN